MVSKSGFFNKRGVSPLIATVLLVSFTIALGFIVLNWGRNLDISKPGDECLEIAIKIRSIGDLDLCYSGLGQDTYINFIVDNTGNIDIDGLGIWIVGEKGTKLLNLDDVSIKKGGHFNVEDKSITYDFNTYGKIKHVQFIPKVKTKNALDICPSNSVKAEKIGIC